jgi:RimJ/RimL family protein N-acetyltransferase
MGLRAKIRQLAKALASSLLGEYSFYYIYTCGIEQWRSLTSCTNGFKFATVEKSQVESSSETSIREQTLYHGRDCHAYACFDGGRIVGLCYFWHGERYRERNFWPLATGEAKLVQLITIPQMRSRSVATHLVAYASGDMFRSGFKRLYARIWHSNKPSLQAFRHVGWVRIALVIEAQPLRYGTPFRMTVFTGRPIPRIELRRQPSRRK